VKKPIQYIKFNPQNNKELLPILIKCYIQVFSEEPWNEYKKCQVCDTKWGLKDQETVQSLGLQHCEKPIIDYWTEKEVEKNIIKDITTDAPCYLALRDNQVIGFCWGYSFNVSDLNQKLKLENIADTILRKYGDVKKIAYQNELGVIKEFRNQGIAKQLFILRLNDFRQQGLKIGIATVKTKPPSVTYHWFLNLGYEIIAEHNDLDGKVILAKIMEEVKL